jgi:hypothetical protein
MNNIRGILHGIETRPLPQGERLPRRTPQERQKEGQALSRAIDEHIARARADMRRHDLAQTLNELPKFWDCYVAETQRAWRSEETRSTYRQVFERFRAWAEEQELQVVPISAEVLSHYLIHLGADGARPEKLKKVVAALRFYNSFIEPKHDDVLVAATLAWLGDRWAEEEQERAAEAKTEQPLANPGPAQH